MFNLNPKILTFQTIQTEILLKLKNCDIYKATGIGNLSGRLLKDGADILTMVLTQICTLR